MYCDVTLIGRLGKDPETRSTAGGKLVAHFSVATSSGKDQTDWHNVVCWEKTAELAQRYLRRGALVFVTGRLSYRKYTDKAGVERQTTEVVANTLKFLEPKDRDQQPAVSAAGAETMSSIDNLDDIPF